MFSFSLSAIVLCALLSIAVSCTRSPFMALMYSVLLFMNASFVMLMLGFEFLALVNLLVYVGALAVLFLFVIMLLEIPATELRAYQRGWSTLCIAAALACRVFVLQKDNLYAAKMPVTSQGLAWSAQVKAPSFPFSSELESGNELDMVYPLAYVLPSAKHGLPQANQLNTEGSYTNQVQRAVWDEMDQALYCPLRVQRAVEKTFSFFGETASQRLTFPPVTFVANMESISSLGHALYLRYADLLILNSLVLTVALFGALVLAHMRSA